MFAVALAFLIFLSVTFAAQLASLSTAAQQEGASAVSLRLRPRGTVEGPPPAGLPVELVERFVSANRDVILDHAWVTLPLEWQAQSLVGMEVQSLGHLTVSVPQRVRGASPNFFEASFAGFTIVSGRGNERVLRRLYGRQGSSGMLLGARYGVRLDVPRSDALLRHTVRELAPIPVLSLSGGAGAGTAVRSMYATRLRAEALMVLAPYFRFSAYPNGASDDVVVSLPTLLRLSRAAPNATVTSVEQLRMQYCIFKTPTTLRSQDYARIKRALTNLLANDTTIDVDVLDTRATTESLNTASQLIGFFFLFTVLVALVICFFSLVSSMYTNIYEQRKEIGVMLALGVPRAWLYRMYVWEAICVVLSSSLLGIGIGVLVAYTVTLQQTLFTQLPVPFAFPWIITVAVVVLSGVFGLLAAVGPLRSILRLSPVAILRGA